MMRRFVRKPFSPSTIRGATFSSQRFVKRLTDPWRRSTSRRLTPRTQALGKPDLDDAGQPFRQRAARLPDTGRAKAWREIAAPGARRTTGAPNAPSMTARLALHPQRAAQPTNANGEATVMRATDMDHDAAKYGWLDPRHNDWCRAWLPPRSSISAGRAVRSFVRRPRPSGWAAVHWRRPAGVSDRPKRHEGRAS